MSGYADLTKYDEDEEIYDRHYAICPYCGYKNEGDCEDFEFYNDGLYKFTCKDCEKTFNLETYISYSYTTSKIKN